MAMILREVLVEMGFLVPSACYPILTKIGSESSLRGVAVDILGIQFIVDCRHSVEHSGKAFPPFNVLFNYI